MALQMSHVSIFVIPMAMTSSTNRESRNQAHLVVRAQYCPTRSLPAFCSEPGPIQPPSLNRPSTTQSRALPRIADIFISKYCPLTNVCTYSTLVVALSATLRTTPFNAISALQRQPITPSMPRGRTPSRAISVILSQPPAPHLVITRVRNANQRSKRLSFRYRRSKRDSALSIPRALSKTSPQATRTTQSTNGFTVTHRRRHCTVTSKGVDRGNCCSYISFVENQDSDVHSPCVWCWTRRPCRMCWRHLGRGQRNRTGQVSGLFWGEL